MRIGFPSKSDSPITKERGPSTGLFGDTQGKLVLPDLPTAILATLRGYRLGTYPKPLEGIAKELGYHPISTATPEEMEQINSKMRELKGSWNES